MTAAERALIEARTWLGTPYQHQSSLKGVGCDCLGLVRGVWRALHGEEPEPTPPYRPDWAEVCDEERLLDAARRWLVEKPLGQAGPGDVLVFRMTPESAAKHCASSAPRRSPGRSSTPTGAGPWSRPG